MNFFDELTQKAKVVAAAATEKAKSAAAAAKITADILTEKRELDKNYRAIGQWFVCEHPDEAPEGIADVVAAVKASQARIEELQAAREKAEAEEVQEPAADVEVQIDEAEEPAAGKVCPACGKVSDGKFCPCCGAPLE